MDKSKTKEINGIKVLDISDINCWIVNLKPTRENVESFQKKCIRKKVFGIGWTYIDHYETKKEIILDDHRDEYIKAYNAYADEHNWGGHISESAMKEMDMIGKGDIVMMRLRDGHYYIGRISKEAFFKNDIFELKQDNEIMSWMCKVEEWFEYKTSEELPAEITGRFSQRIQSTITRVDQYRSRLLMIRIYDEKANTNLLGCPIPKIHITEDNFARALNYMELENLVCKYIYDKHKDEGYMLLPSSGKISQMKYEFTFVNDNKDKKPITCQVKNQNKDEIKASMYKDDFKEFEKIYLFSGNDNINMDEATENIVKIEKSELYIMLNNFGYLKRKLGKYYSFYEEKPKYDLIEKKLIAAEDWEEVKKFSKKNKIYKLSSAGDNNKPDEELSVTKWISFVYNGFFYSEDFDCFVITWREGCTEETIKSVIDLMK